MALIILFLVILLLQLVSGEYVRIGTGRGVVAAVKTGIDSYGIVEIIYEDATNDTSLWELQQDERYPFGHFIHSKAYPHLVWDIKGNKAAMGNPIILYPRKDTQKDTLNQRWQKLETSSRIATRLNLDYVANITKEGGSLSTKAQFNTYPAYAHAIISESSKGTLTFWNNLKGNITLNMYSPVGVYTYSLTPNQTLALSLFPGTTIYFRNATTSHAVKPNSYVTRPNESFFFKIPSVPLPLGLTRWYHVSETWRGTIDMTILANGTLYGTWTKRERLSNNYIKVTGVENIKGTVNDQGEYTLYPNQYFECKGKFEHSAQKNLNIWMNGMCRHNDYPLYSYYDMYFETVAGYT